MSLNFYPSEPIKLFPGGQSIILNFKEAGENTGIGTLTFIQPQRNRYGAYAHLIPICSRLRKRKCRVHASVVRSIEKGSEFQPGQKRGEVLESSKLLGTVERTSRRGIFGVIRDYTPNIFFEEAIPVAQRHEIELGPAKIYTVIDGEQVEEFNVNIKEVISHWRRRYDLVFEVIDPVLIEKTNGIVQGMSGSPIIQKGRFIGAVAYFSRNNSLRGYGLYIGKMLKNAKCTEPLISSQGILELLRRPFLWLLKKRNAVINKLQQAIN